MAMASQDMNSVDGNGNETGRKIRVSYGFAEGNKTFLLDVWASGGGGKNDGLCSNISLEDAKKLLLGMAVEVAIGLTVVNEGEEEGLKFIEEINNIIEI